MENENQQPVKIAIKNLDFFYGEKQAIKDLSLDIPSNEVFCIIGPANSGITTLLKSINRLCDLTPGTKATGEIVLNGQNVLSPETNTAELRRRVGIVFDVPTPLPMSIFDNVAYGPRLLKKKPSKSELNRIVEESLTTAALWNDVKDRLKNPGMALSGGQQQRLCLARVLALQPEVILLDRPCSGLDPISTAKIEESLTLLKSRLTVILAPHSTQQAVRVADRAAFMLKGELIETATASRLFSSPKDKRTNDYITGRFG